MQAPSFLVVRDSFYSYLFVVVQAEFHIDSDETVGLLDLLANASYDGPSTAGVTPTKPQLPSVLERLPQVIPTHLPSYLWHGTVFVGVYEYMKYMKCIYIYIFKYVCVYVCIYACI